MSRRRYFSPRRWWSMVRKECLQLLRDRVTLAMIVVIPLVQLILFGCAVNNDPKNMPTLVLSVDDSEFTRDIVAAMRNSAYFGIVGEAKSEAEAERALATGQAQFVLTIPPNFTRDLLRSDKPSVLLEAGATDPMAAGSAMSAAAYLPQLVARDLKGPLANLADSSAPFEVRSHKRYNPEGLTRFNIVPGMMGVILTLTMVLMTSLAITREREREPWKTSSPCPCSPWK